MRGGFVPGGVVLVGVGGEVERVTKSAIVIDYEAATDADLAPLIGMGSTANVRDVLRAMATPKPGEPLGLGAVVEDAEGNRYVRTEPDGGIAKWIRSKAPDATDPRYVWSALPAVKVLSEGVTDE